MLLQQLAKIRHFFIYFSSETCKKRGTDHLQEQAEEIIKIIEADEQLQVLWRAYQKKYSYAAEIDYASVISGVRKLMDSISNH